MKENSLFYLVDPKCRTPSPPRLPSPLHVLYLGLPQQVVVAVLNSSFFFFQLSTRRRSRMGRFVRVMTNCFAGRLLNSTRHLTSSPNPSVPSWAACQTSCHPGRCKSHSSSAKQGQPHRPVLLDEVLEAFEPIQLRRFVDGTLGAGGHSRAVASAHGELERLYGFDRDFTAHDLAAKNLATIMDVHPLVDPTVGEPSLPPSASGPLVVPVLSNFAALLPALQALDPAEEPNVDGILLDLGVQLHA
jgi:hypothetical protein